MSSLSVEKSRRRVSVRGRVFRAVDRVGFAVARGATLGSSANLVAGKSNIVQVIAGCRDINVAIGPVRSQLISGLSVGERLYGHHSAPNTDAVQLFGGAGYTTDFPVERMIRDKITQMYSAPIKFSGW
jgi:hypothetical protein